MQKTNFKTRLLALLTAAFMIVMCVPFAALQRQRILLSVRKLLSISQKMAMLLPVK